MDESTTDAAETWLQIPGYEDHYEVSDQGRVRSMTRRIRFGAGGVRWRTHYGVVLKPTVSARDHRRRVGLCRRSVRKIRLVHQLVLITFSGPRPPGMEVCHNDGDLANNKLSNLRWDTHQGNMLDMVRHGRSEQANRRRCPRRHPLARPNLVAAEPQHRRCLACARARADQQRARRQGRPFDLQMASDEHFAKIVRRMRNSLQPAG